MQESVVVPLDGSEWAERALPVALGVATGLGVPLHLVRVENTRPLAPGLFPAGAGGRTPEATRRRGEAAAYLAAVGTRVADQAAEGMVVTALLEGPVERELVAYARRSGALLVLTTHGAGGPGGSMLGTVADRVVRWSGLPVVLVPCAWSPPEAGRGLAPWRCERMLVVLHEDVPDDSILEPVQELAQPFGARVSILRADPDAGAVAAAARELEADMVAIAAVGGADGSGLRYGTPASAVVRQATTPLLLRCCKGAQAAHPGTGAGHKEGAGAAV